MAAAAQRAAREPLLAVDRTPSTAGADLVGVRVGVRPRLELMLMRRLMLRLVLVLELMG